MLRLLLLRLTSACVWVYQKTISFDHGMMRKFAPQGRCKYYPSCSEYANQALWKHGLIKGTALTVGRLTRCNPWSKGGVDQP